MREIDFLTAKKLAVPVEEPPVCDLFMRGEPVGRSVGGERLEAAFEVGGFYLLMMGDEAADAGGLTVHLLARDDFEHVESVGLALPFKGGRLRDLRVTGARVLRFRFFEDLVELRVGERAGWRVPLVPDFVGVFRPLGVRRWMRLRRV